MGLSLAEQLISPQNMFRVSCLCTFNPLPLLLKWVMTLVGTIYRNMKSRQSCRTTYMMKIKESERRPFFFIFRRNIVLHDSCQADEIVTEIEEWKQKVLGVYVKSFRRVLKCVGGISCILEKLYYVNLKFDYS